MNMNVQLIQEELHESKTHMPAEMSEMLEATHKEILRLERLVSSFLAFARPTQLHTHACQINDLLSDTLEFLDPEIERSGISLITRFDPKLPEVSIDESQIKQALLNIIQNAIQVLRPEKQLEVTTRKANGDGVEICIRDEGPGISAHELKNVFKVFYSTRKGGTGLGLPIAQHIVELHDGNIEVESQIGKGSVFTMFLPRKAKPA
jgi:signal transduction histidine kinase